MANKKTQNSKPKAKMELAKDKNQLILAGIVLAVFVGVLIFNGVSAYIAEHPSAPPKTAEQKEALEKQLASDDPLNANLGKNAGDSSPVDSSVPPSAAESATATQSPTGTNPAESADLAAANAGDSQSGMNPLVLLLSILVGGLVIYGLMQYFSKMQTEEDASDSEEGKKPLGQMLSFAKNKNQAVLVSGVLGILVVVTVYGIAMFFVNQQVATAPVTQEQKQAEMMARSQQKDLASLTGDPSSQTASNEGNVQTDANDIYSKTLELQGKTPDNMPAPPASMNAQRGASDEVEIMSKNNSRARSGRMVTIQVGDSGRSNPFLPAAENIPVSSLPKFSLLSPPEQESAGSDADKVMGTTISGILYDKYSPSAIITIGGTDYLVKRGDTINRYKILSISKEQVVVQLGKNVYKAGVGQILTPGSLNYNTISNLEKKFAGNSVSVNVRKKSY